MVMIMDIYDKYTKRLGLSDRATVQAQIDRSVNNEDRVFATSPSFYQVDIDGEIIDTIINKTNLHNRKKIHFRKDYEAQIGNIVTFKNMKYLLLETDEDEIDSFGIMEECNHFLEIETGEVEKVEIGKDDFGRPIYEDVYVTKDEPCIVRDKYYSSNDNSALPLPDGKLEVLMKYQDVHNIDVNEDIRLYDKKYKVADMGYTDVIDGQGVMKIHAERRDRH